MRLQKKRRGGFVKLASCGVIVALLATVVCPEISRTFAAEDTETTPQPEDSAEFDVNFGVTAAPDYETERTDEQSFDTEYTVKTYPDDEERTAEENIETEFKVQQNFNDFETRTEFEFDFDVEQYIELSTDSPDGKLDISMNAEDVSADNFTSDSAGFSVSTNSNDGFGLYVYAENDSTRNLRSADINNSRMIEPITLGEATSLPAADFGANTWGYNISLASATEVDGFLPVQARDQISAPAYRFNGPTEGTDFKLTCGTKIDYTMPIDTYATDVFVSAVAPFDAFASLSEQFSGSLPGKDASPWYHRGLSVQKSRVVCAIVLVISMI